jgi:hypothetical protein
MMHKNRRYCLGSYTQIDLLVEQLKEHSWTLCTAFRLGNIILANDSIHEDSLQEYAMLEVLEERNQAGDMLVRSFESLTVSWIDADKMYRYLVEYQHSIPQEFLSAPFSLGVDRLGEDHHRCNLCA